MSALPLPCCPMPDSDARFPPSDKPPAEVERVRERLRGLAWFMDSSVRIPVIGYRFGADALLGLVPGVGDFVGAVLSSYILVEAARIGVSASVFFRMVLNIGAEVFFGLIPLLGDLFDVVFKANNRNVALLERYLSDPGRASASSRRLFVALAVGVFILMLLMIVATVLVLRAVIRALGG